MDSVERWTSVVGHEGRYEVSTDGRVRSVPGGSRRTGKILKTYVSQRGYLSIAWNGQNGTCVHLLVANAFLGPRPSPSHECRHLNGDRLDPRLVNLAWGTKSENRRDSVEHGTHANAAKTHCPAGHAYDGDNVWVAPDGYRRCITCQKVANAKKPKANRPPARCATSAGFYRHRRLGEKACLDCVAAENAHRRDARRARVAEAAS